MLSVKLEIGAEIRGADGTVRKSIPFRECHCLLKQFIMLMAAHISQTTKVITDVTGANRNISANANTFKSDFGTDNTKGILIGTGATTVTLTDYKIETHLTTGIAYEAMSYTVENPDASTWTIAISRSFINNTGGTVNIQEVALHTFGGAGNVFCVDRTLYPVTLEAMEAVALTYRISVTL